LTYQVKALQARLLYHFWGWQGHTGNKSDQFSQANNSVWPN